MPPRRSWFTACVLLIVIILAPRFAMGQAPPPVVGRVVDAFSMRPVAGATVDAGAGTRPTVTGPDGRFALSLPAGPANLTVAAEGYLTERVDITVGSAPVTVEILLIDQAQFTEDVVVTAGLKPIAPSPSVIDVSPIEVRSVAGAAENIFRTLQTLPGVAATEDFGSRLSVRGGGPDQNLTMVDGVEIHNPYRLFGLTSAFNPETVENFELLAGGFGVKYGDRLSSILVIENRAGTRQQKIAGSAALSLTDTNVVVEGRLPAAMTGSWLVTGRRTYYDLVANRITGEELPTFADVQSKFVWEFRPGHRLAVSALRSREHTDALFDSSSSDSSLGLANDSSNDLLSASLFSTIGTRVSSRTTAAWYRYGDDLSAAGDIRDESARANVPGDDAFGRASVAFSRVLGVRDVSLRQEFVASVGTRQQIEAGGEWHALLTRWGWTISGDRNTSEANGSSIQGGVGLPSQLDSRPRSGRGAAWLADRVQVGRRVRLEGGLRLERGGVDPETSVSPRVATTVDAGSGVTLRAAVGLFTQTPGYEKLLQSDYFVDLSSADRARLRSERATHALASIERTFASGVVARAEVYLKSFDRLIVGRLETPAETAARVALYEFPDALAASVPTAPIITSQAVNGASGRAYGFDLYLAHRPSSASERLSGWASYTWGRASTSAYGRRYPLDYDRRHAFSLVGTYRASGWMDVAATVRIASGFPYTPGLGVRVKADARMNDVGDVIRYVPARDAQDNLVWTANPGGVDTLNSAVLPVFARLDLRTTFRPPWSGHRWQFYAEIINVLNRTNAGALDAELTYDPNSDRPAVTYVRRGGFPLLPSVGVRLRF